MLAERQLRDGLTFCYGSEYIVLYNAAISFDKGGKASRGGRAGRVDAVDAVDAVDRAGTVDKPRDRVHKPRRLRKTGFTITERGARYIPGDTQTRINFTLAHEIGHILLGHDNDSPENELAANRFAAELLMPEPIVAELSRRLWNNKLPPYRIAYFFGTSVDASTRRAREISGKANLDGYLYYELIEKYRRHLDNCGSIGEASEAAEQAAG